MNIEHSFIINNGLIQGSKGHGQISRSNWPHVKKNAQNIHILIIFVPLCAWSDCYVQEIMSIEYFLFPYKEYIQGSKGQGQTYRSNCPNLKIVLSLLFWPFTGRLSSYEKSTFLDHQWKLAKDMN